MSKKKHELYAPSWATREPESLDSEILTNLYMGGTHDEETVDIAKPLPGLEDKSEFDAVVTLYAWAQPMGWGVEEFRFGFPDHQIANQYLGQIKDISAWAHTRWSSGKKVLIRCQAGLNRSGLVTAFVLMKAGMTAERAIELIREKRSVDALCNNNFVDWIVEHEELEYVDVN